MTLRVAPISNSDAKDYFDRHSTFRGSFTNAISVRDANGQVHGVIAFTADGVTCKKEQIWTDGSGFVGTLLYGALMRAAMPLGYDGVTW